MAASRLQTSPHAICRPTTAGRRQEGLACALIATAGDTSSRTAQDFSHPRPTRHQSAELAQGHGERRQIRAIVGGDVAKDSEAPADRRSVAGEPPLDQLVAVLGRAPTCRSSAASKARDGVEAVAERGTRQGLPPVVSGQPQAVLAQPAAAGAVERERDTGHFLQFAAGSGGHVDDVQRREERRQRGSPAG